MEAFCLSDMCEVRQSTPFILSVCVCVIVTCPVSAGAALLYVVDEIRPSAP